MQLIFSGSVLILLRMSMYDLSSRLETMSPPVMSSFLSSSSGLRILYFFCGCVHFASNFVVFLIWSTFFWIESLCLLGVCCPFDWSIAHAAFSSVSLLPCFKRLSLVLPGSHLPSANLCVLIPIQVAYRSIFTLSMGLPQIYTYYFGLVLPPLDAFKSRYFFYEREKRRREFLVQRTPCHLVSPPVELNSKVMRNAGPSVSAPQHLSDNVARRELPNACIELMTNPIPLSKRK